MKSSVFQTYRNGKTVDIDNVHFIGVKYELSKLQRQIFKILISKNIGLKTHKLSTKHLLICRQLKVRQISYTINIIHIHHSSFSVVLVVLFFFCCIIYLVSISEQTQAPLSCDNNNVCVISIVVSVVIVLTGSVMNYIFWKKNSGQFRKKMKICIK